MRARGSAGYSAAPLAASISLRFACSRPTPSKGPDAGQRFTVPRDSAVWRRPSPALREEWGESRAAGPGALASWRGRASGLPAPRQLSREDAAARAPPRGGIKPAPLCPPPLPASWSETRGTRGGPGAFRGSGCQAASRRSKELYKCARACLCIHVQHYSMYNVHTTCMHRHVAAHIHTQVSCMFVHACARAKHVSWPRGMHAHVCILQHLCVHTCGHTPAICMCTCNSTRCVHLREEHVCLWVKFLPVLLVIPIFCGI